MKSTSFKTTSLLNGCIVKFVVFNLATTEMDLASSGISVLPKTSLKTTMFVNDLQSTISASNLINSRSHIDVSPFSILTSIWDRSSSNISGSSSCILPVTTTLATPTTIPFGDSLESEILRLT
ncbi:hypothetical protein OGAPHI_002262 [Ogataea philodendri]|uniref:Uncharacterized protein n=1 Tax=Ogataea philodendri TaxID=1378263 RepID=A0A9P8T6V7_9ASCO|nr:uncharacterized protein OGAPHI_002262 [Ogataea philodendri]KAH3668508.1 hypothetical protein OGAPHI_002262 [Ogataea philodendri]